MQARFTVRLLEDGLWSKKPPNDGAAQIVAVIWAEGSDEWAERTHLDLESPSCGGAFAVVASEPCRIACNARNDQRYGDFAGDRLGGLRGVQYSQQYRYDRCGKQQDNRHGTPPECELRLLEALCSVTDRRRAPAESRSGFGDFLLYLVQARDRLVSAFLERCTSLGELFTRIVDLPARTLSGAPPAPR